MTTLSSTSITASQTPAIPRGRVALVALWLTQIALAAMFVFAGGLKLTGAPDMVGLFDAIGIGQWFRYVTGSIEVVSGRGAPRAVLGGVRCAPAHSHDGRRRLHPSVHRRRVCSAPNRTAHRSPRHRVGCVVTSWRACCRGSAERLPFVRNRSSFLLRYTDASGY